MIYDLLAPIYDEINSDLDYKTWADFVEEILLKEFKRKPELVLDLATGTGSMTLELASRGYDMIALDCSSEMLNIAKERAEHLGHDKILWLCQDMREFELYGTVDLIISTLDSINHLTNEKDLQKCLSLVHNYLIPEGLFIFDINGKYKFENVYGDRCYAMETEDSFCVWQNEYNRKSKICNFYITLFNKTENFTYERYDDIQKEKMYTLKNIKQNLKKTGFEFVGAYSDFSFSEADDSSERIYVVARCKK